MRILQATHRHCSGHDLSSHQPAPEERGEEGEWKEKGSVNPGADSLLVLSPRCGETRKGAGSDAFAGTGFTAILDSSSELLFLAMRKVMCRGHTSCHRCGLRRRVGYQYGAMCPGSLLSRELSVVFLVSIDFIKSFAPSKFVVSCESQTHSRLYDQSEADAHTR